MSLRFKFIISQLVAFGRICVSVIVGICFFFYHIVTQLQHNEFEKLIAVRMQSFDRLYLLGMSSVSSCPMPFTTCFILLVLTSPPVLPTTRSHLLRFLLFTQLVYIYPSVIRFMSSLFYILKFPGQNLENLISSTKLIKSVCHQPTQQAPALFRVKGEISRTCALY